MTSNHVIDSHDLKNKYVTHDDDCDPMSLSKDGIILPAKYNWRVICSTQSRHEIKRNTYNIYAATDKNKFSKIMRKFMRKFDHNFSQSTLHIHSLECINYNYKARVVCFIVICDKMESNGDHINDA